MESILVSVYLFFRRRRVIFWISFLGLLALTVWRAANVRLEEDITRIFPSDERVQKFDQIFRNSRLSERLVMMISVRDSSTAPQPDALVALATQLADSIAIRHAADIKDIQTQIDDDKALQLLQLVQQHLPVFLNDEDYVALDSMIRSESAGAILRANYRQLISPTGVVTKNIIVNDPLGFSFLVLKKLERLQYDENFELYDNFIITRDHRHLLFFVRPAYSPDDTGNNIRFLEELRETVASVGAGYPELLPSFFGAAVVAAGNASQLQADTILTVSLMVVLLMVVLLGFFRKKRIPFLILIPVVFGGLFSLACISLFQDSLSILALAVGAVILGVAVDYALHYLVLLKDLRNHESVIASLIKPLTIGSATTVLAFFSLKFTNAAVLQDIGVFAGFSLIGAALCALVFLPHFVGHKTFGDAPENRIASRLVSYPLESKRWLIYCILILTPIFLYYSSHVAFDQDINSLNFMTDETRIAEKRLETINNASLSSTYILSTGSSLEQALQKNEITTAKLAPLLTDRTLNKLSTVSDFLISDSLQELRIRKWNDFWTAERKAEVSSVLNDEGSKLNFSPVLFRNFESLITRTYQPLDSLVKHTFRENFFDDLIIEKDREVSVITLANVFPENKERLQATLKGAPSMSFDRRMLANLFVEYVNADFTYIISVTSVLVFFALLLTYGRIELTLITFVPMLFTWIWILGIMALLDIEFNIVNVMVSTFIFGLGDDYSIFTMDGLLEEYRAGRKHLSSVRTSIFLSAFTTMAGLGVLIFAQHPALRSVAAISIIGIGCVFLMSQTLEPFFFRWLITNRVRQGLPPMTLKGIVITFYTYSFFVLGSFFLTIVGLMIKAIPFNRKKFDLFYHKLISLFTRVLVYGAANLKTTIKDRPANAYNSPAVIISNHSSFLDILISTMLDPRVILLTNKWVWNSPVFGGVVRLADYYPVVEGAEGSLDHLRKTVESGYSIVVFPEGSRSPDGKLRRFHKGAFYIAEMLKVPVQPVLIHGAGYGIPKGTLYVNDARLTIKYLPRITANHKSFGDNYSERTKNISRYFRKEFENLDNQCRTPDAFRLRVIKNYLYKGPVLEWYMRVKLRMENNYARFHELVPARGRILDLGCGYGFLSYMLQFLSEHREIVAVDYDETKIETASHGFEKTDRLHFVCSDVMTFPLEKYDAIIISDVLHYLKKEEQDELLRRCFESLNGGGVLIVRDGNSDLLERHKGTWLTELFSVKILGFNKARNELNFISGRHLEQLAVSNGLKIRVEDETKYTSNVIFVISKPKGVHETV